MDLSLVTEPICYPLTLEEAKEHLRVDATTEDTYILGLVAMAVEYVEQATWRQLITATYDTYFASIPDSGILKLPRPPLQSVTGVYYLDATGTEQTLAATDYRVCSTRDPGHVVIATFPSYLADRDNSIRVRYVCGYGLQEDVPETLKVAMKLLIGEFYKNREATITGTIISALPIGIERVIGQYEIKGWVA